MTTSGKSNDRTGTYISSPPTALVLVVQRLKLVGRLLDGQRLFPHAIHDLKDSRVVDELPATDAFEQEHAVFGSDGTGLKHQPTQPAPTRYPSRNAISPRS
jgi:hypothetical protein